MCIRLFLLLGLGGLGKLFNNTLTSGLGSKLNPQNIFSGAGLPQNIFSGAGLQQLKNLSPLGNFGSLGAFGNLAKSAQQKQTTTPVPVTANSAIPAALAGVNNPTQAPANTGGILGNLGNNFQILPGNVALYGWFQSKTIKLSLPVNKFRDVMYPLCSQTFRAHQFLSPTTVTWSSRSVTSGVHHFSRAFRFTGLT